MCPKATGSLGHDWVPKVAQTAVVKPIITREESHYVPLLLQHDHITQYYPIIQEYLRNAHVPLTKKLLTNVALRFLLFIALLLARHKPAILGWGKIRTAAKSRSARSKLLKDQMPLALPSCSDPFKGNKLGLERKETRGSHLLSNYAFDQINSSTMLQCRIIENSNAGKTMPGPLVSLMPLSRLQRCWGSKGSDVQSGIPTDTLSREPICLADGLDGSTGDKTLEWCDISAHLLKKCCLYFRKAFYTAHMWS